MRKTKFNYAIALAGTIIFSMTTFPSVAAAQSTQSTPWSTQMKEATEFYKANKAENGHRKLCEALTVAKKSNATVPQLAEIYHTMARKRKCLVWEEGGKEKDAADLYRTIISLYESKNQAVDKLLIDAHYELGEKLLDQKDEKAGFSEFAKAIELSKNAKGLTNNDRAWYLQVFALREQSLGRYKEADEHFQQFSTAAKGGGGQWFYELGYFRYLRNFLLQGHYIEAAPVFKTTLAVWTKAHPTEKQQTEDVTGLVFLGDSANDIGYAFLTAGKNAEAAAMLEEAVELREKLEVFSKTKQYTRKQSGIDTSVSLVGLGKSYGNSGQLDKAAAVLQRAYKLRTAEKQPFSYSYGELIDACARFQRSPATVPPSEVASVYKLYGKESFSTQSKISIYLEAVRRLKREGCWAWWDWHHIPILLKLAESEATKLSSNDSRKICLALALADSEDSNKDSIKYQMKVLDSMPQINATTLGAYFDAAIDHEKNDYERIEIYEAELDWLSQHKQFPSTSTKIAKLYLAELTKSGRSRRSTGGTIAKRFEMLSNAAGANSPEIINVLPDIAEDHEHHMRYYDAMMIYRRIVEIYKKQYGSLPKTKQAIIKYSELLARTNDVEGAEQARKEAEAM